MQVDEQIILMNLQHTEAKAGEFGLMYLARTFYQGKR